MWQKSLRLLLEYVPVSEDSALPWAPLKVQGEHFRDTFTTRVLKSVVETLQGKAPRPALHPPILSVMWTVHPLGCGCFLLRGLLAA